MKKIFLTFILLSLSLTVIGQMRLSLEEAVAAALNNRTALKRMRLDIEWTASALEESKRKLGPEITGELTLQYNPTIPTNIVPVGQFNAAAPTDETRPVRFGQPWSNSAGIRASIPVYNPALVTDIKEKKIERALSEIELSSEREQIIYSTTKSYYQLLLAREELRIGHADTLRAFTLWQDAQRRFFAQQIRETERKQSEYALLRSRYSLDKLEANLAKANATLLYNLGLPLDSMIEPTTDLVSLLQSDLSNTDPVSSRNRSDFQKADAEKTLLEQRIRSASGYLHPTVTLNGFIGANQFTQTFDVAQTDTWYGNSYINLNVQIPVSAFYQKNKQVQQAKTRLRQNKLELSELEKKFEHETRIIQLELSNSYNDYLNEKNNLQLSKDIYGDVANNYREGRVLLGDVQTAERDVQQAQFRLLEAAYRILVNRLDYEKAQGFPSINKNENENN